MTPQPEIRIGDAEREAAVSALGEHYAAGRLTKEEYDERAGIAWTAKTNSAIWPLFADLPRPQAGPRPSPASAPRRPQPERRGRWSGVGVLPVLLGVIALVVFAKIFVHVPVLILVGFAWLFWFKTSHHARRDARRQHWDNRWPRC